MNDDVTSGAGYFSQKMLASFGTQESQLHSGLGHIIKNTLIPKMFEAPEIFRRVLSR